MKFRYFLLLLFFLSNITPLAQNHTEFLIAAYQVDGGLYVFGLQDEPMLVMENPAGFLPSVYTASPTWSADGQNLAYQREQGTSSFRQVFISTMDDLSAPLLVAEPQLAANFAFTLDSQILLFSRDGAWGDAPNPDGFATGTWQDTSLTLEAFTLADASREESSLGVLVHEVDLMRLDSLSFLCPSYAMAMTESRWTQLAPLVLADTPYGIVAYFNQSLEYEHNPQLQIGSNALDVPAMINASLSPNREQVIFALEAGNQIGLVNLANQEMQLFEIPHKVEAIVGADERYLYYSVRIRGEESLIPDAYWENPVFNYLDCPERINQVEIYQFDMETGLETLLYSAAAHSIPWMSLSPDAQELYFTAIPNGELWRENMLENDCMISECLEYLFPNLYKLNLANLEVERVLERVLKPVINFGYQAQ